MVSAYGPAHWHRPGAADRRRGHSFRPRPTSTGWRRAARCSAPASPPRRCARRRARRGTPACRPTATAPLCNDTRTRRAPCTDARRAARGGRLGGAPRRQVAPGRRRLYAGAGRGDGGFSERHLVRPEPPSTTRWAAPAPTASAAGCAGMEDVALLLRAPRGGPRHRRAAAPATPIRRCSWRWSWTSRTAPTSARRRSRAATTSAVPAPPRLVPGLPQTTNRACSSDYSAWLAAARAAPDQYPAYYHKYYDCNSYADLGDSAACSTRSTATVPTLCSSTPPTTAITSAPSACAPRAPPCTTLPSRCRWWWPVPGIPSGNAAGMRDQQPRRVGHDRGTRRARAAAGPAAARWRQNDHPAPAVRTADCIPRSAGYTGRSLLPLLRGERTAAEHRMPPRSASTNASGSASTGPAAAIPIRCVRTADWKLAINLLDRDELYDLRNDPGETVNLIEAAGTRRPCATTCTTCCSPTWTRPATCSPAPAGRGGPGARPRRRSGPSKATSPPATTTAGRQARSSTGSDGARGPNPAVSRAGRTASSAR